MIRMLIIGYCFAIRSERRLCEEVDLNLAYRWFCRHRLDGEVPDHSTFSRNRHGRFRQSEVLRHVFETVVRRCMEEGLIGGEGFAVDASLIQAEVGAARTMIDRAADRFGLHPQRLAGDSAYGSAPLLARLIKERKIAPHIPVLDKSRRADGTFSRAEKSATSSPSRGLKRTVHHNSRMTSAGPRLLD